MIAKGLQLALRMPAQSDNSWRTGALNRFFWQLRAQVRKPIAPTV